MTVTRARVAVTAVFFLNGAVFSAWYSRLPAIASDLALSPGELGLALLGAPAGLLIAQPLVGATIARRGSRAVLGLMPLLFAAVVLPGIAFDLASLVVALIVVGAANGALDIAINAQGLVVERSAPAPLFSSLHAGFSFGALAGALLAGLIAALGVAPLPHLAAVAVAGAAIALALESWLLPDRHAADPRARRLARPSWRLAALGTIAFCALLAEGAVFDWSALYLDLEAGASAGIAPLGLAAFSLTMGVGRLGTDRALARWGAARVARAGAGLAAVGIGAALASAAPAGAIAGFGVMGLGLAAVFPLTLRAASTPTMLAAVSSVGYLGFLLGPPLIGLAAEAADLRLALVAVCAACLVAAGLAGRLPADGKHR